MDCIIVDGHQDIAMALMEDEGWDFAAPASAAHALSLPDAKRGGIGLIMGTVFATRGYWKGVTPSAAAQRQMKCYDQLLKTFAADLFRVESRGDLSLCQIGGPIGLMHLMEGADPIRSPRDVKRWVDRGVRVVGPAWNTGNRYCGGWEDADGLTADGVELIQQLREHRAVVDVSHLKPEAFDQVFDVDDELIVASHSNTSAIHPHRRNLSDEQIKRIAERDGLVGIVLFNKFVGEEPVTLDMVFAHIEHMIALVGPEHVGLGSDLDGGFPPAMAPRGIDSVADLRRIGEGLASRGYADSAIENILGGNWIRVLRRTLPE